MPWKHIGKSVDTRSTRTVVQLFCDGELIKTHVRKAKGKQTDLGDYPPEKIAFFQRTPTWCRKRATEIGSACTAVIEELLAGNVLQHRLPAQQTPRPPGRTDTGSGRGKRAGCECGCLIRSALFPISGNPLAIASPVTLPAKLFQLKGGSPGRR